MKTISKSKIVKVVLVALIPLMLADPAIAYPPDNAAVLYYRACLLYQPDDAMKKMLTDLSKGKIKLNKKIKKYVKSQHNVINTVVTAANLPDCDWGYDYSQGFALMMPGLSALRNVGKLILADAEILAAQGKYKTSLERCLTIKKMTRHICDRPLITHLVGIAMNALAHDCIVNILADMPQDLEALNWFKSELVDIETRTPSMKAAVSKDFKTWMADARIEKKDELLRFLYDECLSFPEYVSERLKNADEHFFERNRDYSQSFVSQQIAAFDLPYEQAYTRLKELSEIPSKDAPENPDATLTVALVPAVGRLYGQGIRVQTFSNAIRAAVDIYIIRARTGRLPETLPAGLPKDLFSAEDFEYEKIDDGFILRCQGRDLLKDTIHQYEFKIKK